MRSTATAVSVWRAAGCELPRSDACMHFGAGADVALKTTEQLEAIQLLFMQTVTHVCAG